MKQSVLVTCLLTTGADHSHGFYIVDVPLGAHLFVADDHISIELWLLIAGSYSGETVQQYA